MSAVSKLRTLVVAARRQQVAASQMTFGRMNSTMAQASTSSTPIPPLPVPEQPHLSKPSSQLFIPPAEDPLLSLMTNVIMRHGERHKAARHVANTLAYIHSVTLCPPLPILREAIDLASPMVKVVSLKKSSKSVPSPRPLDDRQRAKTAIRWIVEASESRKDPIFSHRLGKEIINVFSGTDSSVIKKKEAVHKLAAVNRANAPRR